MDNEADGVGGGCYVAAAADDDDDAPLSWSSNHQRATKSTILVPYCAAGTQQRKNEGENDKNKKKIEEKI